MPMMMNRVKARKVSARLNVMNVMNNEVYSWWTDSKLLRIIIYVFTLEYN